MQKFAVQVSNLSMKQYHKMHENNNKKKKILVGLSWGVDSAVAAYLLKEQGHEVVGGFMKNYLDEENPNCTTRIDSQEAIKVAKFLGIELLSFDFIKEYEERIIQYIYSSYEQGITPNPDILCNSLVKFDLFLEKALEQGFDAVATGHYARIRILSTSPLAKESAPFPTSPFLPRRTTGWTKGGLRGIHSHRAREGEYQLLRWIDYNKDQSYFLSGLNQYQLSKAVFPLGALTKPEVREIAEKIGLPNATRKDSQGLCFIWNIKIRNFLAERLVKKEGNIVLTDWTVVGKHQGAYFFTIGQSRGLDINKKAYVCKIDVKNNELVVSYDKNDPLLLQQTIQLRNWHWISENTPGSWTYNENWPRGASIFCTAKIRYRHVPEPATLQWNHWKHWEEGNMKITFDSPQWWIAPGQSIVAYDGDVCLGGGVIV